MGRTCEGPGRVPLQPELGSPRLFKALRAPEMWDEAPLSLVKRLDFFQYS